MEARIEGEAQHCYGFSAMDLRAVGKRNVEWNLNDWKWDGDLFVARQLNPRSGDTTGRQLFPLGSGVEPTNRNSSKEYSSCSDEGSMEKKRRAVVIEDGNSRDDAGSLSLKLGGHGYPATEREIRDGNVAKKTRIGGYAPNLSACQVESCGADMNNVKDYHKRHKVCEMHSKATSALVGGIMQRFCQQCSRFHVLQEFDEGKRSCRRRLAGHNKRRRKSNLDAGGNVKPLNDDDDQTSSYLLISLLKILSNLQSNSGDQDLLSRLLKSLISHAGEQIGKNVVGLLQGRIRASLNAGSSSLLLSNGSEMPPQEAPDCSTKQIKMNDFDLNDIYIDPEISSLESHRSSPPQTSRNSDSASEQSPSTSNGDAQSRTDRIVFKLFGKDPNDLPIVLREQILDWLFHSPTDMESYIRPGCIVLTIYLCQPEAAWEQLCNDLGCSLKRLLDLSHDSFWRSGWIYARVQNQIAFTLNGQVVIDTSLPLRNRNYSQILSIRPIAATAMENVQFTVKGINLKRPGTRLICAVEGEYMVQGSTRESIDEKNSLQEEDDEVQCISFSCDIPIANGRGFMEIEDHGLSSSFSAFIVVAEDDVCSEIRMIESSLEFIDTNAAKKAMEFVHELGWLLQASALKSRLGEPDHCSNLFSLARFKWLMEFSMDHHWCAVVRKLLNLLFDGMVGSDQGPISEVALAELCLLHRAVRKNSIPMIDTLLRYVPQKHGDRICLFRPDAVGPAGLTPLHIAAGKDDSDDVLDALTEDPGMVGIEAWKTSRDSTGFTPEDYARLRGHFSYIHLVQHKLKKHSTSPEQEHFVVDMPVSDNSCEKLKPESTTSALEISQTNWASTLLPVHLKICDHRLRYGFGGRKRYRPAMLSMVAIAAVCVCVALLFKSCPEVLYVFQPFRWELLNYGTS